MAIDPDAVERVMRGDDLPTDIHGLAQMVGRVYVELHQQINALDKRAGALEADVATLTKDVRAISNHFGIDAELDNISAVRSASKAVSG
jgi:predicted transcriptional regulator